MVIYISGKPVLSLINLLYHFDNIGQPKITDISKFIALTRINDLTNLYQLVPISNSHYQQIMWVRFDKVGLSKISHIIESAEKYAGQIKLHFTIEKIDLSTNNLCL